MKQFTLVRDYKPEATLGRFVNERGELICCTLERPKIFDGKENLPDDPQTKINESCCIPEGKYFVQYTQSFKFKRYLFLITGVNGREGIRIHCANWINELLGCVATAMKIEEQKDVTKPELKYKAVRSQEAMTNLMLGVPEKFELVITSTDTLCNV